MSTFTERLKAHGNSEARRVHSPEYIEAVWLLMIACGGVLTKQNEITQEMDGEWYYGSRDLISNFYGSGNPDCSWNLSLQLLEKIREHGVNFQASSDPSEDTWEYFAGTFTDHGDRHGMLWGKLVLDNGEFFWMAAKCDDFGKLVRVLNLDLTLEEALENLEERLTDPRYDDWAREHFGYHCEIPEF